VSFFLKQRWIQINLGIMTMVWLSCSFDYYLIGFQLKYFPGNIYVNTFVSSGSEMIAYGLAGIFYNRLGAKISLFGSFVIALLGGFAILINGALVGWDNAGYAFPIFVLFAKFGIASSFNIVYVCNIDVFPTLFQATSFGIVNFGARLASVFAPQVAELNEPWPMLSFVTTAIIAAFLVIFLRPKAVEGIVTPPR